MMHLHQVPGWMLCVRIALLGACPMSLCGLPSAGCGGGAQAGACRSDDDCPGGACVVGRCRPLSGADLSGLGGDLGSAGDLATPIPDGWNPDALTASCSFNSDGTLQRAEEPFIVGLGALFAVNAP